MTFQENLNTNQNLFNKNGPLLSTVNVKLQNSTGKNRGEDDQLDLPKSPETEKNQTNQEWMDLELSRHFNQNILSGQHILELDQSREEIIKPSNVIGSGKN